MPGESEEARYTRLEKESLLAAAVATEFSAKAKHDFLSRHYKLARSKLES